MDSELFEISHAPQEDLLQERKKIADAAKLKHENIAKMLSLSIAYASNIGGTATLTGTPTNLLVAEVASKYV